MKNLILIFTISFFVFILWVIYLANTGSESIFFDLVQAIPYGDKIGHIVLYGILSFALSLVLNFRSVFIVNIKIYYGVIIVALFAFIEEITQAFYPNRTLDLLDIFADIIGFVLATFVLNMIEKK